MASKMQALILILLSLLKSSFSIKSSEAGTGGIAIYWGQNLNEGYLNTTCDSGNFEIVLLAFLTDFGDGRTPKWNFAGHCGDWSPCTKLEPDIKHCQEKGVKVFLSLGGANGEYSISSADNAKEVANYLYGNFLSGQSGPLGSVALDGIDFDIEGGGSNLYWDDLARELDTLRHQNDYFYLSAAPQCPQPDYYLDKAINTSLFNYIFVQFYNNPPCQYSNGDTSLLLQSWEKWTSSVLDNNTVLMGLPASPDAAPSGGYIPPQVLISDVLPKIKQTPNYGGIMLWSRVQDLETVPSYSDQIRDYVSGAGVELWTVTGKISEAISECVSAALHRIIPKSSSY